jgi:hypothetical protein
MKLRGLTTALACAALFATIHSAAATSLVDEGSTTYDPNAGLRWLDLNLTQGLSYNQVLASSYVTAQGFRFATETELKSLYAAVGITSYDLPNHSFSEENAPKVSSLLGLLACTTQCVVGSPAGQGWVDIGSPTATSYAFFQFSGPTGVAFLAKQHWRGVQRRGMPVSPIRAASW